jgi:hypothetical protein
MKPARLRLVLAIVGLAIVSICAGSFIHSHYSVQPFPDPPEPTGPDPTDFVYESHMRLSSAEMQPLQLPFIPVVNPEILCIDDTHSPTEWFQFPVVRFSGTIIDLGRRKVTAKDLLDWAMWYYSDKAIRVLFIQIAPGNDGNAEQAIKPLVLVIPDLYVRQVDFEFSCPKIHRKALRLSPRP